MKGKMVLAKLQFDSDTTLLREMLPGLNNSRQSLPRVLLRLLKEENHLLDSGYELHSPAPSVVQSVCKVSFMGE